MQTERAKLLETLENLGMTQSQAARELGVYVQTVLHWGGRTRVNPVAWAFLRERAEVLRLRAALAAVLAERESE